MNMKQDEQWDMTRHAPMPRLNDDDGYFEQMSRAVFLFFQWVKKCPRL